MGRSIDEPLDIDFSSIVDRDVMPLSDAYAKALMSRPEIRLAKVEQRKSELERRLACSSEFRM